MPVRGGPRRLAEETERLLETFLRLKFEAARTAVMLYRMCERSLGAPPS